MSNITTAYLIECRTGCSCCSNENHYRGPFSTKEAAEAAVNLFKSIPLLSSQYASHGSYNINEASCEQLSDGRLIINFTRVSPGFFDDNPTDNDAILEQHGY